MFVIVFAKHKYNQIAIKYKYLSNKLFDIYYSVFLERIAFKFNIYLI